MIRKNARGVWIPWITQNYWIISCVFLAIYKNHLCLVNIYIQYTRYISVSYSRSKIYINMTILKPLLYTELSQDPKSWAKRFSIPEKQIMKLLDGNGSIQLKTAKKFQSIFNETLGMKYSLEELFEVPELKWFEDREVEYEFWVQPMEEEEKIGIIRYIFEKRLRAYGILDIFIFLLILAVVLLLINYLFGL